MSAQSEPGCLVLAEGSRGSALHVARSLSLRGVPVKVGALGGGEEIFRASRHCTDAWDLPTDETALVDALLGMRAGADLADGTVLLPTSDRLVAVLHRARDSLRPTFRLLLPDDETTLLLLDKVRVLESAEDSGLDVPASVVVDMVEEVARTRCLRPPLLVKPRDSLFEGGGRFKFEVHTTHESLEQALRRRMPSSGSLLVQEYVQGPDSAVESFLFYRSPATGRTIGCTVRKLRQDAPGGGVMAWGEAVNLPDVRDQSINLIERIGFSGLGGTEFKRHDGKLWFIELNPRLEAIHFLAMRAGVDLPWAAYAEAALGTPPARVAPVRAAGWVGAAWVERVRRDRRLDVLAGDFVRFLTYRRRVFGVFSMRDPMPWLVLHARLAKRLLRSRGSSAQAA